MLKVNIILYHNLALQMNLIHLPVEGKKYHLRRGIEDTDWFMARRLNLSFNSLLGWKVHVFVKS